ncbi:hypothetical protein M2164_008406 [Streptomyces sp. SAI-208]|nr:hypothetical protein [Streptomyces sp. SAI-208]
METVVTRCQAGTGSGTYRSVISSRDDLDAAAMAPMAAAIWDGSPSVLRSGNRPFLLARAEPHSGFRGTQRLCRSAVTTASISPGNLRSRSSLRRRM